MRSEQLSGGNHGLTPEQVADSQRERVLAAMREAVAADGYQAVPVARVIRQAGVSRKTFYELYSGKEEAFVAVYEREMERLLAPTLQAFEGGEPWVDRLRTALGVLLSALAADAEAARICFVEALAAGPLALERRNAAMGRLDPLFAPPGSAGAAPGRADAAGGARAHPATAGSVGYLAETLQREIAAGRIEQLPALRSDLMRTLTPRLEAAAAPGGGAQAHAAAHPGHARAAPHPGGAGAPDAATEDAFLAAYGEIAADLLGRVGAAIATDEDPATRVRAGVAALLDFCAAEPDRARACLVEALSAGTAARERRTDTNRRLAELFAQPLRELRPSDRIAEISAISLVGGFHELTYDPLDRRNPARLPSIDTIVSVARLEPAAR